MAARRVSRENQGWRREFEETLPDLREDSGGSGFAITGYTVQPGLGGDSALTRLRERLRKRGLRLLLASRNIFELLDVGGRQLQPVDLHRELHRANHTREQLLLANARYWRAAKSD